MGNSDVSAQRELCISLQPHMPPQLGEQDLICQLILSNHGKHTVFLSDARSSPHRGKIKAYKEL